MEPVPLTVGHKWSTCNIGHSHPYTLLLSNIVNDNFVFKDHLYNFLLFTCHVFVYNNSLYGIMQTKHIIAMFYDSEHKERKDQKNKKLLSLQMTHHYSVIYHTKWCEY